MSVVNDFIGLYVSLRCTSSTNAKKEILKEHLKDNEDLRSVIRFLLDKNVVTGIKENKIVKKLGSVTSIFDRSYTDTDSHLLDLIAYLKENNTGTDDDIRRVQRYLFFSNEMKLVDPTFVPIIIELLTKTLRLGVDATLVNKAVPGTVPVHEIQQAFSIKEAKLKNNEWICLSQKLNGNRATYVKGKLLSRQGKEFKGLNHILSDLNKITYSMFGISKDSVVYDGEIIRKNIDNLSDNENFRIGTGVLNSKAEDKSSLKFVIFDVISYEDFQHGESQKTYRDRLQTMLNIKEYIETSRNVISNVDVVPFLYYGTDHSMIEKCLERMDKEGKEGCMLARDVAYKCKRHNGLLKVKSFYTMDLPVIGFEQGTGKNENTLGNIVVDFKGNNVGVGSGFSDNQRHEIWNNKDQYIGKIAEVKYKDITRDKTTSKESLQFPVFVQWRNDKSEVSYS